LLSQQQSAGNENEGMMLEPTGILRKHDKVAVITGGGSGIGRATALAFLAVGYDVALVGRRLAPLEETLALHARQVGGQGRAFPMDVADEQQVQETFAAIQSHYGRVDFLFNNAGYFPKPSPVDELSLSDWDTAIGVNLTGAFLCAREAVRLMKAQSPQGGRIVNNGSISAHSPRPQAAAYTASKHAISGLTKALSLEGRAWNIACGQIDIGNAATDMTASFATALQADGSIAREPMMAVSLVADAVLLMAGLPLDANVLNMTVMASGMPFVGRG
jgi:NAD(P)-dependent dehydrogenase (short-subunit alcohol dehydrogenase family)